MQSAKSKITKSEMNEADNSAENIKHQENASMKEDMNDELSNREELKSLMRLTAAKQIILDFIRQHFYYPECCKASILKELGFEYIAMEEIRDVQDALSPAQVIKDGTAVLESMHSLHDDYAKEHDHAEQVLSMIVSRYVPKRQKGILEELAKKYTKDYK